MPIRRELQVLYPPHWHALSHRVRFERAAGRCQRCGRPHLALVRCLPDGRWFDAPAATWRDRRGKLARRPDLLEATRLRTTRVVLATAHLDGGSGQLRMGGSGSTGQLMLFGPTDDQTDSDQAKVLLDGGHGNLLMGGGGQDGDLFLFSSTGDRSDATRG